MLVSCRATPRSVAYCSAEPARVPKMFKQISPTADATRMQYLVEIGERLVAAGAEIHLDPFDQRLEGRGVAD